MQLRGLNRNLCILRLPLGRCRLPFLLRFVQQYRRELLIAADALYIAR
jgi:hypothetical protein